MSRKRMAELDLKLARYSTPSYRKMRSGRVVETISFLKAQSINYKVSKTVRDGASRRLQLITYFDYKPTREFVAKYIKFVSLTTKVEVSNYVDYVISLFERVTESNGINYSLKLMKNLYGVACRFSTSNSFEPISFRKTSPDGLPILLGPLAKALKGTYNERKAILSALQLIKIVEHHEDSFSLDTITKEGLIKQLDFNDRPIVGNYFKRFIEEKGHMAGNVDLRRFRHVYFDVLETLFPTRLQSQRLEKISKLSNFHISARNGPSGPSLTTAAVDYCSLGKDKSSMELWDNIKRFSVITKNDDLDLLMSSFENENPEVVHDKGKVAVHSKISLKKEPWGRVRPFAIIDYFTQSSMVGTHEYLFRYLASLPEDGTFDQDRVSDIVKEWTVDGSLPESADLSAATDSIPVEIQAEIMSQIAGRQFGKLWMNIVSNRDFSTPDGELIRYKTGQPMGVLTSFAMLAVWHHVIAQCCLRYERLHKSSTKPMYCIIGDDITMKGQQLFHTYETVVSLVMGVGISKTKGFHLETQTLSNPLEIAGVVCKTMSTAELAKRIFCNGVEITPIPATEVKAALESPLQFPELFRSLKNRGYSGYLNASDITSLASLCTQSWLGLTLAFSPLAETPLLDNLEFDPKEDPKLSKLIWLTPNYDRYVFDITFMQVLEGTHAKFTQTLLGAFSTWYKRAQEGAIVTAGWKYFSVTQSGLLQSIVIRCGERSEQAQNDFMMNYTSANSLVRLRKDIRLFQTMFELGRAFVDPKKARALDRKLFTTSYINIVLKQTLIEMRNRDLYS